MQSEALLLNPQNIVIGLRSIDVHRLTCRFSTMFSKSRLPGFFSTSERGLGIELEPRRKIYGSTRRSKPEPNRKFPCSVCSSSLGDLRDRSTSSYFALPFKMNDYFAKITPRLNIRGNVRTTEAGKGTETSN